MTASNAQPVEDKSESRYTINENSYASLSSPSSTTNLSSSSCASQQQHHPHRVVRLETRSSKLQQLTPEQEQEFQRALVASSESSDAQATRTKDPTMFYSSLLAGILSGSLSSVLCAPLDLVRVRMQVWGQVVLEQQQQQQQQQKQSVTTSTSTSSTGGAKLRTPAIAVLPIAQLLKQIRDGEGYRGFFKGLGATLLTVPVFWAIYFPCYDEFKHLCHDRYPHWPTALIHMGSAVSAGAISDVVCNPMFVVRTRLQTEALHHYNNSNNNIAPSTISQTVRSLYSEGGLPIFWRGMTANLIGLSHVAIQFPLYERLKKLLKQQKRHESALDLVLASSLSKMMASLISYPHEVIRSRMMDSRCLRNPTGAVAAAVIIAPPKRVSFRQTCSAIYGQEGFRGFYAGLPISMIRVIPNTCVTFVTYELILRYTRQQIQEHRQRGRIRT